MKNKYLKLRNKILNETTSFCISCNLREKCIEKECVIFRIETIIEKYHKKKHKKINLHIL